MSESENGRYLYRYFFIITCTMRRLVYHVATSLDNFIAREDGSTPGFVAEGQHVTEYLETLQTYDTILMGRATYEAGYQYGVEPG